MACSSALAVVALVIELFPIVAFLPAAISFPAVAALVLQASFAEALQELEQAFLLQCRLSRL